MFLDLCRQFGQVQLSPLLRSKVGAIIQIVKKMLIGIRTRRRIFGKSLKHTQVSLRGLHLVEAPLDHGELVVSGSGVAADLDISSEQGRRFLKFLVGDSQICQLQQALRRNRDSSAAPA